MVDIIRNLIRQARLNAEARADESDRRGHPTHGVAARNGWAVEEIEGDMYLYHEDYLLIDYNSLNGAMTAQPARSVFEQEAIEAFKSVCLTA